MQADVVNSVSLTPARKSSDRVHGMSSAQFARLRAIGEDPLIDYSATLERIYRETCNHLDILARHVGEGKNFLEVSLFLRWLEFSGLPRLLERHAPPGQDFSGLRLKLDDLVARCRPLLQGQRVRNAYSEPDIEAINRKLDYLLAALARPVAATSVNLPKSDIVSAGGSGAARPAGIPCLFETTAPAGLKL